MTTETRWKAKDGGVVSVRCEVPEWPNKDADGETIYERDLTRVQLLTISDHIREAGATRAVPAGGR